MQVLKIFGPSTMPMMGLRQYRSRYNLQLPQRDVHEALYHTLAFFLGPYSRLLAWPRDHVLLSGRSPTDLTYDVPVSRDDDKTLLKKDFCMVIVYSSYRRISVKLFEIRDHLM